MEERKGTFSTLLPMLDEHNFAFDDSQNHDRATVQATGEGSKEFDLRTTGLTYGKTMNTEFLPEPTRNLYDLVGRLVAYALHERDSSFTRNDAKCAAECLHQHIVTTNQGKEYREERLLKMTEIAMLYRFHASIGDYAGAICKALRSGPRSTLTSNAWITLVETLDREAEIDDEGARHKLTTSCCPVKDAVEAQVETLNELGWTGMDLDQALFAVRAYARRNTACHSRAFDLVQTKNYHDLGVYLEKEEKNVEFLLPPAENHNLHRYRSLIRTFRDRHVQQDGETWVEKARSIRAPKDPKAPFSKPAIRAAFAMGKFRPKDLVGAPPTGVTFDKKEIRRHSELAPKQPPLDGFSNKSVHRAQDPFDQGWEGSQKPSNEIASEYALLLDRLYGVQAELRNIDMVYAKNILSGQITKLKEAIETAKGRRAKKGREPLRQK